MHDFREAVSELPMSAAGLYPISDSDAEMWGRHSCLPLRRQECLPHTIGRTVFAQNP